MQDLERALPPSALEWVQSVALDDKVSLLAAYSGAARKVGKAPVALSQGRTWGTDELARALLLLRAYPRLTPDELWQHGDNRERQAVLKALPYLPDPDAHVALAVEACRSNVLTVFEAIACENPFPAAQFPELHWNQLVLKAAFNGVALARIVGLDTRHNAELARMAADFAAERRAAGRPVPDDLGLVMKGAS
ncbi:MAG TPA: EboA domain-containing protein [Kofleriaceae bacterium]|nr:EboA domain-containing protein [Kofleriaceae bacterium]